MNLWHDIAPARVRPEDFFAVIEIEKGSKNKYEMDKETGALRLDRILYTSTHYPANYGFIPRTWADDGDPLDVLVLCSECIRPLSLVECYPIGVITMEDVLEALVGDIWDEKDVVENEVVTRPDGGYELDGAMTLSDFLELLDWNEDALDDADSTTVGGWTLERFGTFPKVGDSFRYENLTVTVLAMDGRRVERVLVQPDPDADKDKDA